MDRILINDLLVRCVLGVGDDERREKQDVVVNIALSAGLEKAGRSDSFGDAIDYRSLKKRIVAFAEASEFRLVEALAENIARMCLEDPRVVQAQVRVEKPGALRYARSVSVEVVRAR